MSHDPIAAAIAHGFVEARPTSEDAKSASVFAAAATVVGPAATEASAAAFGQELARCLEDRDDSELAVALAELHVGDLWLAFSARTGDSGAVTRFEREFVAPLGPTIRRIDSSESFVDEVRQRVRAKLLVAEPGQSPRLDRYRGRGELATWVRVVAAREALSMVRGNKRRAAGDDEDLLALEATTTGPELGAVKEQYREAFGAAFRAAIGELSAEQRNVLRLHYLHGLTVDELGGLLKVHRSSAARRVAKARAELLATTRRKLLAHLQLGRHDFDDLMQLIASRIDVSIERHLGG